MYFFQYSILCAFLSIFMFLYGFFLLNYDGEDPLTEEYERGNETISHSVDKIVFMIIDGIRLDFVDSDEMKSNMPHLHSATSSNHTCIFPCRVHLPTVTMPRVKALTVGTVPSFVDIALNFGSSRLAKDSIINQLVKKQKKIVFYGDDTWIKLFPDMFTRQEGTTSFFVSDFFEVDTNVTRNVNEELKRDDWDVMILHYLGLDHIGHVEGSFSSKISSKLQEMDAIIGKLNEHLLNWKKQKRKNYLLVICGDHGMKDAGGHGGSTLPEVMVPFVTLGVPCTVHGEISQVDVAVTLSTLLGLSFPKGNVGKLIKGLVHHLTETEKAVAYRRNSEQLLSKFLKIADEVSLFEIHSLLEDASGAYNKKHYSKAIEAYEMALHKMSETLVRSLTKYDPVMLYCAVLLAVQSSFIVGIERCSKSSVLVAVLLTSISTCFLYEFCHYSHCDTILCSSWTLAKIFSCVILFILSINTVLLARSAKSLLKKCQMFLSSVSKDALLLFLILGSIGHICSSLSTSFIEEEHMTWYFLWTTVLLVIGFQNRMEKWTLVKILLSLSLHRILRKLNQTGDKWSALPDINDWFRTPDSKHWLSVYMVFGLLCSIFAVNDFRTVCNVKQQFNNQTIQLFFQCIDLICLLLVYNCRAAVDEVFFIEIFKYFLSDRGTLEFQTIFTLQILSVFVKLISLQLQGATNVSRNIVEILIHFFMIWSSLLLRPYNIVLISSLFVVSKWIGEILKNKPHDLIKIAIVHHWLALVYFFYQGNSNSFSSIDVTPGYIGQKDYNPVLAGFLIIFSTYALPILAYLFLIRHFLVRQKVGILKRKSSTWSPATVLLCSTNFYLALFMTITTVQRNHLFIWSVFSPKMIYLCAYNVLLYPVLLSLHLVLCN